MFKWCATYYWKALDKVYNFALSFISIEGLHAKLWAPKVAGAPAVRISRLPGQNDIWVLVLWLGTKYTIRWKAVAHSKSRPW
jgi:hypothetical protein